MLRRNVMHSVSVLLNAYYTSLKLHSFSEFKG